MDGTTVGLGSLEVADIYRHRQPICLGDKKVTEAEFPVRDFSYTLPNDDLTRIGTARLRRAKGGLNNAPTSETLIKRSS